MCLTEIICEIAHSLENVRSSIAHSAVPETVSDEGLLAAVYAYVRL
jgi:hypothetical protein